MKLIHIALASMVCALSCWTTVDAQVNKTSIEDLLKQESSDMTQRRRHGQPLTDFQASLIRQLNEDRKLKISTAREAYRIGKYAESAKIYETVPSIASSLPSEKWEVAEAYFASGNMDKALEWYRKSLYQTVTFKQVKSLNNQLSPRAVLPVSALSLEDATQRFPDQQIESWADQSPLKLGRFAIVLAQQKEYAEAIAVYQRGLDHVTNPEWKTALALGNITAENFDTRRFQAAAHTLAAAGFEDNAIQWNNLTQLPLEQGRTTELNEALRIKPDYAPALYIKADIITRFGDQKTKEEYASAKKCLDKAEQYARSGELRVLIQKLRTDQSDKLR